MIRLNLGSSDQVLHGYTNVDLHPHPGVLIVDLSQPWPWKTNEIDEIRAHDIIEHLPDKMLTMNEAWRVLKPRGMLDIVVPTTDGQGAFQDPTHVSFWNRNSFLYYTDKVAERERFGQSYGILARFVVVKEDLIWYGKVSKLSINLMKVA